MDYYLLNLLAFCVPLKFIQLKYDLLAALAIALALLALFLFLFLGLFLLIIA